MFFISRGNISSVGKKEKTLSCVCNCTTLYKCKQGTIMHVFCMVENQFELFKGTTRILLGICACGNISGPLWNSKNKHWQSQQISLLRVFGSTNAFCSCSTASGNQWTSKKRSGCRFGESHEKGEGQGNLLNKKQAN